MFYYSAYGVLIQSDCPLPGFSESSRDTPDISILRNLPLPASHQKPSSISLFQSDNGLCVHWPGVASYTICEGRRVIITPTENGRANLEQQPLYGIVLAAILQQRGLLILHGSSVEINGRGLLIIGQKGYGKSTITASLLTRGHGFLTDDVTALKIHKLQPTQILPGIPRLKLWPDAVRVLGFKPEAFPLVAPTIQKHVLCYSEQFRNETTPLQTIVMLKYGNTTKLTTLSEKEKSLCLLGNQYFSRYHHAFNKESHHIIFQQCTDLARQCDIVQLQMVRDITSLPRITTILEEYIAE